jgi:hypothetical protein
MRAVHARHFSLSWEAFPMFAKSSKTWLSSGAFRVYQKALGTQEEWWCEILKI